MGAFDNAQDKIIDQLARLGIDSSKPCEVSHFLYFPTFTDALACTRQLEAVGYTSETSESGYAGQWLVLVFTTEAPESDNIVRLAERFDALAVSCNGKYDGWECEILPEEGEAANE